MPRAAALLPILCSVLLAPTHSVAQGDAQAKPCKLMRILGEELAYSTKKLVTEDGTRPYFLAYTITDIKTVSLSARLGALHAKDENHERMLDVDVRVGDHKVDNSHKIRGAGGFNFSFASATEISVEDDPGAIKHAIWLATDSKFKEAVKTHKRVLTNLKTQVEEDQKADDFSKEEAVVHNGPTVSLSIDMNNWTQILTRVSGLARNHPLIYSSAVTLKATGTTRYMVSSEGSRVRHGRKLLHVSVRASTKAEDGMNLSQAVLFNASSEERLPGEAQLAQAFQGVIDQVLALRQAPLVEPFAGPAILRNRASAVFFHEIFGHRIEGHRQKDVDEGQTFAKKIGERILPVFIDVCDDPTLARHGSVDLRGYYEFDDEAVPAGRVHLVAKGVLQSFLMSRSPLESFPVSNGHGRRAPGNDVVSRQGNLIVESSNAVSFAELRKRLVAECKKCGKPYGLLLDDITGGFTMTRRYGPQAFKVLPVVVYRVYADGRADELVRGVDIVGTPLTCFSTILCTGDDPAVFNGTCGAESGPVPVSAISPSILVSQLEVEKRQRSQERLPILPSPLDEVPGKAGQADDKRRDK